MNLTHQSIDFTEKAVIFATLKKRRKGIYRAVSVPDTLMVHGIQDAKKGRKNPPEILLWDWHRKTAWVKVCAVMETAGIANGPHRSPKGLRHGFGVTAIYANALGEEQRNIAAKMWG